MKPKFSIYLYVALLPTIIYSEKTLEECANDVTVIAKNGGLIEGVFQPLGNEPIGIGSYGFVYRGILHPIQMEIAMKFTGSKNSDEAKEEYEMFSYLEAINDPNVEQYGIPVVYYYGEWNANNLFMIGMSLLEKDVYDLVNSKKIYKNPVNFLIIMRDFIMASKYMHSHAIRHDDIKLSNIMVRKHRAFLIDFNVSSKMNERSYSGTRYYISRRAHTTGERYPKDDWESFLYSICESLEIPLPWLQAKTIENLERLKENTTATIELIKTMKCHELRDIIVSFAEHVFDDGGEFKSDDIETVTFYHTNDQKRFPDYNHWYKIIDKKINESNLPKPVMFTWLTPKQRMEAIADLKKYPIPDITKIDEPKDYDYFIMDWSDVDRSKFKREYKNWQASSTRSFLSARSSDSYHTCSDD